MAPNIYIFEVRLLDTDPSIWRIVELKNNSTLHDLHRVIQAAMGWENTHLYSFMQTKNGKSIEYNLPQNEFPDEIYHGNNPINFKLKDIFSKPGDKTEYLYDFGDCWKHEVVFRGNKYPTFTFGYPVCAAGAMACPPENIGGIPGFKMLLNAIENKQKKELNEYRAWLGFDYDPYDFSEHLLYFSKLVRKIK
jgi:hypothetical protein